MLRTRFVTLVCFVSLGCFSMQALAAHKQRRPANEAEKKVEAAPAPTTVGRSKALSFEEDVVEGMNRNPFDSMTSVRTKEMKGTSKLYRVKGKFGSEVKLTVEEAGFTQ